MAVAEKSGWAERSVFEVTQAVPGRTIVEAEAGDDHVGLDAWTLLVEHAAALEERVPRNARVEALESMSRVLLVEPVLAVSHEGLVVGHAKSECAGIAQEEQADLVVRLDRGDLVVLAKSLPVGDHAEERTAIGFRDRCRQRAAGNQPPEAFAVVDQYAGESIQLQSPQFVGVLGETDRRRFGQRPHEGLGQQQRGDQNDARQRQSLAE